MRKTALRYLPFALILLLLIGLARGLIFRPTDALSGAHYNRAANAVWLDVDWLMEPHTDAQITDLANRLHHLQVRYVYVFASYLKANGQFNPTYTYAPEFVRAMKAAQPDLNVQAWIGLPLDKPSLLGGSGGHVRLSETEPRLAIALFCAELLQIAPFDGIHIDAEPIVSGDGDILVLLEEVRWAIGPGPTLSFATRRIQPFFPDLQPPLLDRWAWTADYYREIAKRVDQVALMTYDSALPFAQAYRLWTRLQVMELSRALAGQEVDVLIGIPTSEEKTTTHWPSAESMESGLLGTIDGLNDADAWPDVVTGVAIYPEWETDAVEWAAYESLWLGRQ